MPFVNGIYLPGWEFNRLLANTPLEPRISALPGAALWNGAAHFWMFEKVYCTKESFDNEAYSAQELGWATGSIFTQLAGGIDDSGPILEPVDWTTLDSSVQGELKDLCSDLKDSAPVREWIDQANDSKLQQLNDKIVKPIAQAKNSIIAGGMSGLRQWISPSASGTSTADEASQNEIIGKLLSELSAPVTDRPIPNGIQLISHPSTWAADAVAKQDDAKKRVETPYIRELQAGEGEFAGAHGYIPYIKRVGSERAAYSAINDTLLDDWNANRTRLLRLREQASVYLWPKLHGDWLPALVAGNPDAIEDFPRWINRALAHQRIAEFLNLSTAHIYYASLAALTGGLAITQQLTPQEAALVVSVGASALPVVQMLRIEPRFDSLAIFYQKAFNSLN
ncbi:hypothetical protein ACFYT3_20345 [Nocardia amikacinitolerans]|uniref:hypothetical protein n=1 Tax=Nocardia amikacinitolerans TaxID=756689 RepID=UPI0036763C41